MPVVIPESAWDRWLDPTRAEGSALAELKGLLVPAGEAWLETYPVSRKVNSVRNDGPELIEPVAPLDVTTTPDVTTTADAAERPTDQPADPDRPRLFPDA
jgi:hypothetical protein